MYRQILVPVQLAAEVEPLVRFASLLLEPAGEIRVLHIIAAKTLPEVTREWRKSVNLVVPAHEVGAVLDVKVEPEVRVATDVPGEILESAETHGVDAIVFPLRGDRRSRNPFVGHTGTALLQHARANVLVVNRLTLASGAIPRVLLPTFGPRPAPRCLALAEEVALKAGGVPLVTLALGSSEAGATWAGSEPSTAAPVVRRAVPLPGSILGLRRRLPGLILGAAARERYGLLVVGEEEVAGGSLLTRRFLEQLFRQAPCPVVAVRP